MFHPHRPTTTRRPAPLPTYELNVEEMLTREREAWAVLLGDKSEWKF